MNIGSGELAVVLGAKPSPAEKRVTELLGERIKERTDMRLAASGAQARYRLLIGTVGSHDGIKAFAATRKEIAALGADGYCLVVDPQKPELYVIGQSDSGVVAGVGRLMRDMRYDQGTLGIPARAVCETPQMPNRGTYLWARKHYFNHPDRVDRYIEELALWGCNAICLWFEMGLFKSFGDTEEQDARTGFHDGHRNRLSPQEWLALYRRFYKTARRMGMKTGLIMVANDAYRTSPQALRISPIIGCPNWYLCPSKPGSVEQMVAWQEEVFEALAPIDIYNIFPADSGGCSCKDCTPWPTRGLWKVAKPLGDRIHKISPMTEIWVDTWHLNHPTFGGKDWRNLVDSLDGNKKTPAWFAGFEVGLAPHHRFARMAAEDRAYYNQAKQPLTVFTEISMFKNHRGMLVKKEYWRSLRDELNDYDPKLMKGGWLYAERWNTDIAIAMFNSWYWNPKKTVDAVLDEWAALYFGAAAETGRELLDLLDDSNRDPDRKQKIGKTLAKLDAAVPEWVKRDWRWNEIAASASRFGVSPRARLAPARRRDPTTVASSEFSVDYHAGYARDGVLSSQDGSDDEVGNTKVVDWVEVAVNGRVNEPVAPAVTEAASPVKQVRVVLPRDDDLIKRIASVFARQVEARCSANVSNQGEAPLTVALSIDPAIGEEGFRISDRPGGVIEVAGQNERGVLYGLGKLLRTSRYSEEAYATMRHVDRLLSPQVRKAWRWRQLYLRALPDAELKANGGKPNDLCNQAFVELVGIYHAQNAEPHVRPPCRARSDQRGP